MVSGPWGGRLADAGYWAALTRRLGQPELILSGKGGSPSLPAVRQHAPRPDLGKRPVPAGLGHSVVWPQAKDGVGDAGTGGLSMLLEGIAWRLPARTWQPEMAG